MGLADASLRRLVAADTFGPLRYPTVQVLPDLFREARALAEVATGHEQEEAYAIYAVCCKFAHTAAHALGHPELVAMACERAGSARLSGDPVMPAWAT